MRILFRLGIGGEASGSNKVVAMPVYGQFVRKGTFNLLIGWAKIIDAVPIPHTRGFTYGHRFKRYEFRDDT